MKKLELLENTNIDFYNVFEDLKDLNEYTLDLFEREDFEIQDVEDLSNLKININILNNMIDKKVSDIYQELIDRDL